MMDDTSPSASFGQYTTGINKLNLLLLALELDLYEVRIYTKSNCRVALDAVH